MWLKPDSDWCTLNPFTKVNSLSRFVGRNFNNQIHLSWILFPSALADGSDKLLHNMALASFLIIFIKCLIQKMKFKKMYNFYCSIPSMQTIVPSGL